MLLYKTTKNHTLIPRPVKPSPKAKRGRSGFSSHLSGRKTSGSLYTLEVYSSVVLSDMFWEVGTW